MNPAMSEAHGTDAPKIDVRERGAPKDGEPQFMDRRLFMQLLVYTMPQGSDPQAGQRTAASVLKAERVASVLYADLNDPRGIGILTWSEDPDHFVLHVRPALQKPEFQNWQLRPEFTMLGRSYSSGYEQDLEYWLLTRPKETVLNDQWNWAVWYPLRRTGAFNQLPGRERGGILREHATIGRAYGEKNLAHDVRLACHGLDANDNEFVIGLIGEQLHPLSHVVQSMRSTRQTAEYIQHMGPFFVGHAIARCSGEG